MISTKLSSLSKQGLTLVKNSNLQTLFNSKSFKFWTSYILVSFFQLISNKE